MITITDTSGDDRSLHSVEGIAPAVRIFGLAGDDVLIGFGGAAFPKVQENSSDDEETAMSLTPRQALLKLAASLALGLVALAPATAGANDRDLRGTPVPAAACIEYRRSPDLPEDPWKAGYFGLTGDGEFLQLRCPLPVNNVDLSGTTDDNDLTQLRVHYRDSDAFGGGAGVQVVISRTFVNASGNAQNQPVCFWASNPHGTGATTAAKATRACAHDLAAGSFYHVDVFMGVVAGNTAQFLGVDFPS